MSRKDALRDDVIVLEKCPDGGYGWVIVICSFLLQGIACGISFSVGVFFVEWLEIFGEAHDVTAWVGSLNTGLMFAFGPLASVLIRQYGHRAVGLVGGILAALGLLLASYSTQIWHLYATYGLLGGIGVSFIYIPAAVVCSTYFDRLRPLALGLATSGVGLFCLAIPPLLRLAIDHYGWRNAMVFMSALCIQSCLFSFLLFPVEFWQKPSRKYIVNIYTNSQKMDETELLRESRTKKIVTHILSVFDLRLLGDLRFVIFFLNNILWNIGSLIILVMITDYADSVGMSKASGPWLISIIGLTGIVGRAGSAAISNLPHVQRFWVYNIATVMTAFAIGGLPFYENFAYFACLCALYGLSFGAQVSVLAVTITELFGVQRLAISYGYIMVAHGLGASCGPPIGGALYEATQGYRIPFYFGGAVSLFTALLACLIPIIDKLTNKKRYIETEEKTVDNLEEV